MSSTKGCDIIGFQFHKEEEYSPQDTLIIFEAKAQFSGNKADPRLQEAVNGSEKDQRRKAKSLNAYKQRFLDIDNKIDANRIQRFQDSEDRPYLEISGAAALFSDNLYDQNLIMATTTRQHPNHNNLRLIIFRGQNMMDLVHELYRRAADEA